MKRYFLSAFSAVCLILAGSLSFTGCNQEVDLDTNQYKETVALNAYGPLPVLRGGTLRFLGSNLDQIASIELPGASPITTPTESPAMMRLRWGKCCRSGRVP